MALLAGPPLTVVFHPKLRHRHRLEYSPSHFYTERRKVLQPRTSIITIHDHRQPLRIVSVASESDGEGGIPVSEVMNERRREVYWSRKWNSLDIQRAGVVASMHLLCLFAPFTFNWEALWVAIGLYMVTGVLGITLSFHRHLSHKSFKIPKWLEYTFAYIGVHALQGDPMDWVRTHWYHHQYTDTERDPHSPIKGICHSYILWLFDTDNITKKCGDPNIVIEMEKQLFYRFIRKTYIAHSIALAILLYAFGGIPFVVWGVGVRTVCLYHNTWIMNTGCHMWGYQKWATGDLSGNIWWIGILSFGEGWHNNHHAFQYSAKYGLEWWQIDITWYFIRLLETIGMATDVKRPNLNDIKRKTLTT